MSCLLEESAERESEVPYYFNMWVYRTWKELQEDYDYIDWNGEDFGLLHLHVAQWYGQGNNHLYLEVRLQTMTVAEWKGDPIEGEKVVNVYKKLYPTIDASNWGTARRQLAPYGKFVYKFEGD